MIIPYLSLFIFALLGSWMMLDNTPSFIIAYFPEFVGRIVMFVWFSIVRLEPVVRFHVWLMPVTSILYYSDLLVEMTIMQETPLGGHPVEGDE